MNEGEPKIPQEPISNKKERKNNPVKLKMTSKGEIVTEKEYKKEIEEKLKTDSWRERL